MIKFERGSHIYSLFTLISVVGEFPTASLRLLMNYDMVKKMVNVWSERQEIVDGNGEVIKNCKLFSIVGEGKYRRIRIHSSAYKVLEWINMYDYYYNNFVCKKFPSTSGILIRRFREAEAEAVMYL